jgi:catechol 2,3-dioxygenase-like lactoylglutathione lyase family enzyme
MKIYRILGIIFWGTLFTIALIAQTPNLRSVEAVGITVSDLDHAVDFYTNVLHFKEEWEAEKSGTEIEHLKGLFGVRVRVARLRLGSEEIELSQYLAPLGRPVPGDSRSNDLWFQHIAIVVSDMDQAYSWLRDHHVQHISSGPQTLPDWNREAAGIQAFYFRDPDGHSLELIHFPVGKGDSRWQQSGSDLFLGIDHTAIAVSNTDASLAFYHDQLGMRIAGMSENYGVEQEHLNNVFGARLRITSLRAPKGPGVELLEYLVPRNGRHIPEDARANDLTHWETLFDVDEIRSAWSYMVKAHVELISSEIESDDKGSEFLFSDPDGHVIAAIGPSTTNVAAAEGRGNR